MDDVATGVLAALGTRAADGLTLNLAEPTVVPVDGWVRQVASAAQERTGRVLELVRVPDEALPADLGLTAALGQHLLASVSRAEEVLGWSPGEPTARVAESVAWHVAHPPEEPWTGSDDATDDAALQAAR